MATPYLPSPQSRKMTAPTQVRSGQTDLLRILPAVVFFYAILLPPEVRMVVADQTLTATRILGLLLMPLIGMRIWQGFVKLVIWDAVYLFSAFWIVLALMVVIGASEGLVRGGGIAIDMILPYLIARVSFSNPNDLRRFLVFAAPGVSIVALTMLAEVLAGRFLIRPWFASLLGGLPAYVDGAPTGETEFVVKTRLGMIRAMSTFSHPIHAGIVLASFLPLYLMSGLRGWPRIVGAIAALFAFFSVSSAAILFLIIGVGLFIADWMQKNTSFLSWKMIIGIGAALTIFVAVVSGNGLLGALSQISLDQSTANYRRLIWEYGSQSVIKHPWFGIAFESYERPSWMFTGSVDHHWLATAIKSGLPASLTLFAVAVTGLVGMSKAAKIQHEHDRKLLVGLAISSFLIVLTGFSVTYFGNSQNWFYMVFGIAITFGTRLQRTQPRAFVPAFMPPQATPGTVRSGQSIFSKVERGRQGDAG